MYEKSNKKLWVWDHRRPWHAKWFVKKTRKEGNPKTIAYVFVYVQQSLTGFL